MFACLIDDYLLAASSAHFYYMCLISISISISIDIVGTIYYYYYYYSSIGKTKEITLIITSQCEYWYVR